MSYAPDIASAFEVYAPQLRAYLSGLVYADDVEDVLSTVFESALRNLSHYEERGHPLVSWLYVIARSKAIDQRRRYIRNRTIPLLSAHARIDGPEESVSRRLMHEWLRERITCCLTGDQRRVIWLRFVVDLSITETAARLSTTEGAVKALQHRGVANLRVAIAPDDMPSMMYALADAPRPSFAPSSCGSLGRALRRRQHPRQRAEPCRAPACERPSHARGYCITHYERWRSHGTIDVPGVLPCAEGACDRDAIVRGYCRMHYRRWKRMRQQDEPLLAEARAEGWLQ